jgi:hypothetical protein
MLLTFRARGNIAYGPLYLHIKKSSEHDCLKWLKCSVLIVYLPNRPADKAITTKDNGGWAVGIFLPADLLPELRPPEAPLFFYTTVKLFFELPELQSFHSCIE